MVDGRLYTQEDFEKPDLCRDAHIAAFFQSVLFWGSFIGFIVLLISYSNSEDQKMEVTLIIFGATSLIMYLMMICFSFRSDVFNSPGTP